MVKQLQSAIVTYLHYFYSEFSSSGLRLLNNFNVTLINLSVVNCTHQITAYFPENSALSLVHRNSGRNVSYVQIYNSHFYNNSVEIVKVVSSSEAILGTDYSGRGGALGIFINEPIKNAAVKLIINECNFTRNAAAYGGAIYLHSNQLSSGHNFIAANSVFDRNYAAIVGGGIAQGSTKTGNFSIDTVFTPSHYHLKNCSFIQNTAQYGGAVNFVAALERKETTDTVSISNCTFVGNIAIVLGAALMISSMAYPHLPEQDVPYNISNWYV